MLLHVVPVFMFSTSIQAPFGGCGGPKQRLSIDERNCLSWWILSTFMQQRRVAGQVVECPPNRVEDLVQ